MGRTRKVFHAIWSGYLLTALSSLLNLVTIPVALAALGKAPFGLWSAVAQTASLVAVLDMGLGPSMARFLSDYKDDRTNPAYAGLLKSVFFVGVLQGLLFGILALSLTRYLPALMGIPGEESHLCQVLLLWQLAITAATFPLRPLSQLLVAHQEIAALNGCTMAATTVNAVVLVCGLRVGWGIYSYVVASWIMFFVLHAALLYFVVKLRLLPDFRNAKISLATLKPLARFSSNVFLLALGLQLFNFAPVPLVTRHLGVQGLADWTVGTRLVLFATQLVARIPGAAEPALWEMYTRRELPLLRLRLLEVGQVAALTAALLGGGITVANPSFIRIWTSERVDWSTAADICFALWVVAVPLAASLNVISAITKHVGAMKFVYFLEGAVLMALAYLPFPHLRAHWQVALALFLCVSLFRLPYGCFRAWRDMEIPALVLARMLLLVFGISLALLATATGLRVLTAHLRAPWQLAVNVPVYGLIALPLVYALGLPPQSQQRLRALAPGRLRRESAADVPSPPLEQKEAPTTNGTLANRSPDTPTEGRGN